LFVSQTRKISRFLVSPVITEKTLEEVSFLFNFYVCINLFNDYFYYQCNIDKYASTNNDLLSPESQKSLLTEIISLASTSHQNTPSLCSSSTIEDTKINPDTTTGQKTDSKVHSQVSVDVYVFNSF